MAGADTPGLRSAGLLGGGTVATVAGLGFGTPGLVVLGVGLAVLPALAWVAVRLLARSLRVERAVTPSACVAGDRLTVRCRPAGLPVRLGGLHGALDVEIDPRPGSVGGRAAPTPLGPGQWRIGPVPRGDHVLSAPVVRVADPLGLARHARAARWTGVARVRAVPATVRLERLALVDGSLPGAGSRTQQAGGAGELDRVREYRPGDPLGRIHWGHTARRGRLHTKELRSHDTVGAGVELVLDGSLAAGGDFELAVSVAATVARHLLSRGERVSVTHTGGHPGHIGSSHATWGAIEGLLTVARPGTDTPAADAVAAAAFRPDRPAAVIAVSAGPGAALAEALAGARAAGLATGAIIAGVPTGAGVAAVEELTPTARVRDAGAISAALTGAVAPGGARVA